MIQVDVFWSFAIGSTFAASAALALQRADNFYATKYFAYAAFWLGAIFAPSGIFLLWAFPDWESMFVLTTKEAIAPILPTVFSSTNVLFGVLGFYVAFRLIRRGELSNAHRSWIVAYSAFAAILGFGYNRFLFAGTHADWAAGKSPELVAWFSGNVFKALLGMAPIVLPTYMIPLAYWYSENYEQWQLQTLTRFIVVQSSICWIIGVVGFYLYVFLLNTESYRATIARGAFGFNAPVAGFTAAQIFVFVLCLVPIVAARIMQSSSSSTSTSTPTRAPRSPARTPRATRASSRSPARYSRA